VYDWEISSANSEINGKPVEKSYALATRFRNVNSDDMPAYKALSITKEKTVTMPPNNL